MRSSPLFLALVSVSVGFLRTSVAQTQAQIQACANTVTLTTYQSPVTYSTDDTTHFYGATFSYDPALCNLSPKINVERPVLTNLDSLAAVRCSAVTFGSSGTLTTTCSKSFGAMALEAKDGDNHQSISIAIGQSPTFYTIRNDFVVLYTEPPPPPPPPSSRKRQLLRDLAQKFDCPSGHSYCWTGRGKEFACLDTSSDILTCGGCPDSTTVKDCSAIVGVDSVQCRSSRCHVISCAPGYRVSPSRMQCIRAKSTDGFFTQLRR